MSRKHAELERELIEDLEPRTGRTLAAWMAAIESAALSDKNAIIDWLRPQGLTFAHASWLERIHNNGGRPIYIGAAAPADAAAVPLPPPLPLQQRPAAPAAPRHQPHAPPMRQPPKVAAPIPAQAPALALAPAPAPRVAAVREIAPSSIDALLARGKGLRPLADLLLREIRQVLPDAVVTASGDLVSVGNPAELAVLLVGPRELRLGLALGEAPAAGLTRARPAGAGPHITHTLVLADARQIGPMLADLAIRADGQANPKT